MGEVWRTVQEGPSVAPPDKSVTLQERGHLPLANSVPVQSMAQETWWEMRVAQSSTMQAKLQRVLVVSLVPSEVLSVACSISNQTSWIQYAQALCYVLCVV